MHQAFVAGATGYTGREVVRILCEQGIPTIAHVRPDSSQLDEWRERFIKMGAQVNTTPWNENEISTTLGRIKPTLIFNLIGTTKARMRRERATGYPYTYDDIDFGLTALLVQAARRALIEPKFIHLSAAGAGRPRNRYYRAKWKAEEAVRESCLPYIIARPSFIIGSDRDDRRPWELLGARLIDNVLSLANRLGGKRLYERYRSTTNTILAQALVDLSLDSKAINTIYESESLRNGTGKRGKR